MLCSAGSQVFELLFWTSPKTISDHRSISFAAMLLTKLVADHSRPLSPPDSLVFTDVTQYQQVFVFFNKQKQSPSSSIYHAEFSKSTRFHKNPLSNHKIVGPRKSRSMEP